MGYPFASQSATWEACIMFTLQELVEHWSLCQRTLFGCPRLSPSENLFFIFFNKNGSWRGQGPTRPTCTSARPTDYTRKWKMPSGGPHNAWNQGRSERHIFVWPGYCRCARIVCRRWKWFSHLDATRVKVWMTLLRWKKNFNGTWKMNSNSHVTSP